ncbi:MULTISPECIES: hypothetical protein [Bacillus cereus group]|uniref:hypothetical protein n=1 Tax=Bacillus cereus group TaxID=86661 RepID=UPI001F2F475B|nr:hypothetical protein [Bacillus cereus]MDA1521526.1 hypothetical protein [Bacillus cereus]BCC09442.1 hypothetical protein BCM0060_p2108 [Bacillus cereus]BCC16662.1 hypothetical protein BCM0075_1432 [Bacillus cereus]BCC50460.1 hypothetical protein BCJMU02_p2054 [Bacillus cereus]BCD08857.1 hypothetical protein BC30052_p2139 [Bacillus cereus]
MVAYQFRQNITCPKCGSSNVKLRDNMYYVRLAKKIGLICCLTIVGIPLGIGFFVSAAQKKKQPIGMIQCLSCGKTKNYKKGELYIS